MQCCFRSAMKLILSPSRGRANMAHVRQSGPDSGLGFQAKVLETFQGLPALHGSGPALQGYLAHKKSQPPRAEDGRSRTSGGAMLYLFVGIDELLTNEGACIDGGVSPSAVVWRAEQLPRVSRWCAPRSQTPNPLIRKRLPPIKTFVGP